MVHDKARSILKKLRADKGNGLNEEFWDDISDLLPRPVPRTDVFVHSGTVFVVMEVPGAGGAEGFRITSDGKSVTVHGNIPYEYPVSEDELLRSERFTGSLHRKIRLPVEVVSNSAIAKIRNGLLVIRLLERPGQGESNIPVEAEG
jgi:HSP20 family protein